jgi:hypothetical protein
MDTKEVRDLAQKHKVELERRAQQQEEEKAEHRRAQAQMVAEPWNALGQELKEFEKAYNAQFGGQGIYVDTQPDRITVSALTQSLTLQLNRKTGIVSGEIDHEPLELRLHGARGEAKLVWVFDGTDPAAPADIALALGRRLTNLSVGIA